MLQKIINNDQQWERAKEEVTQVVTQHDVTQTKLTTQEQISFTGEQRARVCDNICACAYVYCVDVRVCKSAHSLLNRKRWKS